MKKNLNLMLSPLAGLLLLVLSCGKTGPEAGGWLQPAGDEVTLTVRLGTPATKVAAQSATNEKMIRNVQVFVFRAGPGADAGNLEIAASAGFNAELEVASGSYDALTLKCSTGQREVWAVVNDSRDRTSGPEAVTTLQELLSQTHQLADSRKDKLLMCGGSDVLTLREGKEEIRLDVHRLAASVVLQSVKNDFSSPAYQKPGVFRVEDCYLLNVPGRIRLDGGIEPAALPAEAWLGRLAAEKTACEPGLIYDQVEPKLLDYGSTDTTPHAFYSYPNDCTLSEEATWGPRATLLVLEASLYNGTDWTKYYYPVALTGGLVSNRQYSVALTIHRPGSLDPNIPVKFDDVTPVIQVSDWETGESYDREI